MRRVAVAVAAVVVLAGGAGAAVVLGDRDQARAPSPAPSSTAEPDVADTDPSVVGWAPSAEHRSQAREIAQDLSLPDLAGQLIIAKHTGSEATLELVRDLHFAGVLVNDLELVAGDGDELARIRSFNADLEVAGRDRGAPVLRPIDQEGGRVARVRQPLTIFGTFMGAGAAVAGDREAGSSLVRAAAAGSAAELRALGYNAVFAPVADLAVGADQSAIGSRSAGSSPTVVADTVVAMVQGHADAGLLSSVKHFPGHNVSADSHLELPVLEGTRKELDRRDLVPFVESVDRGAPAIMTGHLDVPALDGGTPASLSRAVVTGVLREELGYDGLIISDALDMGAVTSAYPAGEAAVAALVAGSDLALMPADNRAAHSAVLAALRSGELSEQQARDSAARTIAWLLAHEDTDPLPGKPGQAADAARALALAGATVVSRPCDRPLTVDAVTPVGDPELVARFTEAADEVGVRVGSGPTLALVGVGGAPPPGDIVVTTDTPHPLARSRAPIRIALHGNGPPAMRALAQVLAGEAEPGGSLAVDVPGLTPTRC